MSLREEQIDMLKRLVQRPLTVVDFKEKRDLKMAQNLVGLGYARDFGDQWGRRVPVRLRIWGITGAGRAVLEQQALAENMNRENQSQLSLVLTKPISILGAGLTIKPVTRHTHTRILQKRNGLPVSIHERKGDDRLTKGKSVTLEEPKE